MSNQGCDSKMEKHLFIDESIDRLNNTVNELEELLHRINNSCNPPECWKDKAEVKATPSLSTILDTAGNKINNNCDRILGLIDEIKISIF